MVRTVGVFEDDKRTLAAQFESDALQVGVGGARHNQLAHLSGSSERNLAHVLVVGDRGAGRWTISGNDVKHSGRETGLKTRTREEWFIILLDSIGKCRVIAE